MKFRRFKIAKAKISADITDSRFIHQEVIGNRTTGANHENIFETGRQHVRDAYSLIKTGILIPVGILGLDKGLIFPDLDIRFLGLGYHRFFFFHSAIGLFILQKGHRQWIEGAKNPNHFRSRVVQKVTGTALGCFALGVGTHLSIDIFQPKSIVFPWIGSLVNGTLIDDRLWLAGNAAWSFKIAHDVLDESLGEEYASLKSRWKTTTTTLWEKWQPA